MKEETAIKTMSNQDPSCLRKWILGLSLILSVFAFAFVPLTVLADAPHGGNRRPLKPIEIEHMHGEVLVKFRQKVTPGTKNAIHKLMGSEVLESIPALGIYKIRGLRGQTAEELIRDYGDSLDVEYVEPNGLVYTMRTPNDPHFSELYGLNNIGQTGGRVDSDIDAPEAWDRQIGSPAIVVADIDSGVDYNHPDLAANIWSNPGEIPGNGIDDDGNGYIDDVRGWDFVNSDNNPMDDNGHGTHTSGTIAAVGDNGIGVTGVSWQSRIMPLKFIDSAGSGTFTGAASAIIYAANMGAKVASNSWGCGPSSACYSQVVEDAIAYADSKGMLFVVAAGNSGSNNDAVITYPCTSSQPNVVCVAATDYNDQKASFSSYGATTVDLGAPGVNILSTVPTNGNTCCSDPSGYKYLSGTSMATPYVAGAAALLFARAPDLTIAEAKNILLGSTDLIPALAGITVSGGRLNINNAIISNFAVTSGPEQQTVIVGGASVDYTIRVRSLGGFTDAVGLTVTSPDPTITGSFSPVQSTPPADGFAESMLTISTSGGTASGVYTLKVTGTDGLGETHSADIKLYVSVADFTLSVTPALQSIISGGSTTYNVTLTSINGYNMPVTLSMSAANPNIQGSFTPNPVTPPVIGSASSTMTLTTTSSIQAGGYSVTVQGTDGIRNHTATAVLNVTSIDLAMTAVSGPVTARPGTTINISNTVRNQGIANAGLFVVAFYLSTDAAITTADYYLGSRTLTSLAGGASSSANTSVIVPAAMTLGTYYIGAIADFSNVVMEANENNNALAGNTVVVSKPDLITTAVSGPAAGSIGLAIAISNTVKNQGTVNSSAFYVGFYLSADAAITTADRYIGRRYVSGLSPGLSSSGTTTVTIPIAVSVGTYYIGAIVDYTGLIPEADEGNNALSGNAIFISKSDLLMTFVSGPASAPVGSGIIVSDTVSNQGAGNAGGFYAAFYLSKDAAITTADKYIGRRFVTGLASGVSDSLSATVMLPANVAAGTYYIGAIADYGKVVPESNEANNAITGNTITITP